MTRHLIWQTNPGLRGWVCSNFRAVETGIPDGQQAVAISVDGEDECESCLAELEMHFAAQRFETVEAAFEAVKGYALKRAGGKNRSN